MKRSRENGQEPELEVEPAPKKAFGFEMKLSSAMVRKLKSRSYINNIKKKCSVISLFQLYLIFDYDGTRMF